MESIGKKVWGLLAIGLFVSAAALTAHAQEPTRPSATDNAPTLTLLPHSDTTWWWLSGQVNVVEQSHDSFPALYSGPHSFRATAERALSRVLTLYTGARLPKGWQAILDVESAGGQGLSDAFGLAGFTNLTSCEIRPWVVHRTWRG